MSGYDPTANQLPYLVTMNMGCSSDEWLRVMIRGERKGAKPTTIGQVQRVIVQGSWEANRIIAKMANLCHARKLPYGGAIMEVLRRD